MTPILPSLKIAYEFFVVEQSACLPSPCWE